MATKITNIIKEWKDEAGVESIILISAFPSSIKVLKICTDKPGPMIGLYGSLISKYTEKTIKSTFG